MSKKLKEPWQSYPTIWKDEKAFMAYLRGAFRAVWSKYPAKLEWKKQQMVKPPAGYTGRAKTVGYCAYCDQMFSASSLEVDHIEQAGSFGNKEEAVQWFWRLLDTNDNWCLACIPCHKIKSYAERMGISFQDAKIAKQVIAFSKESVAEQTKILANFGRKDSRTKAERRRMYEEILRETR